jgi:FKBP-type peptidyl-prolyl cis-trans isomerase FkpA
MLKHLSLLSTVAMLTLASCASNKELKITGKTESGYPYGFYVDEPGESPQVGDKITYSRRIRLNQDSVLMPLQEQTLVLPPKEEVGTPPPPDYELMFLLSPGDSASVLLFGENLPDLPDFKKTDTIIFDLVFKEIVLSKVEMEKANEESKAKEGMVATIVAEAAQSYISGQLTGQLTQTSSGLKYKVINEGTGQQAKSGDKIEVNYYGALTDGKMFDNSFQRGETFSFQVGMGQVIPGWDEGLLLLKEGGSAIFFIPAELGYGAQGSPPVIPANAELIFYVDFIKIQK